MSSSGSPDNFEGEFQENEVVAAPPPKRRLAPWLSIIISILALAIALFIGSQVLGVLYGIFFPPHPPIPSGVTQLNHKSEDYGVDEWIYGTDENSCDMVTFYVEAGGVCKVSPLGCAGRDNTSTSGSTPGDFVANCSGEMTFSIFAMRWEVDISTGYEEGPITHLRTTREVFWAGTVPRTPEDSTLPETDNSGDN
jgi:hypothetical protein